MKIFSEELVEKAVKELHIANLAQATIGDVLLVAHHSLNIFSEILFYRLSLYISRLQMYSFGLNIHEISRF